MGAVLYTRGFPKSGMHPAFSLLLLPAQSPLCMGTSVSYVVSASRNGISDNPPSATSCRATFIEMLLISPRQTRCWERRHPGSEGPASPREVQTLRWCQCLLVGLTLVRALGQWRAGDSFFLPGVTMGRRVAGSSCWPWSVQRLLCAPHDAVRLAPGVTAWFYL